MVKYFIILVLFAAGCTSSLAQSIQTVNNQYDAVVYDDGIDEEEAKTIGQRAIIKKNFVKIYDLSSPVIATNVSDLPNHEQYWFVSFKEKKVSNIEFVFMAVVHRETGRVKFADDFQEDKRWILEAALHGG